MNSKDIENKIKELYKDVRADHFKADDKRILQYERHSLLHTDPVWKEEWHKKNTARLDDPAFREKLSEGQKKWHADNPGAAIESHNTPEAIANSKKGMQEFIDSGNWVMPSFEGQTHTEEVRKIISETHSGRAKPLEGNKKISEHFKGKKKSASSIAKAGKSLTGRTMKRGRRVMTPKGEFDKIKLAAQAYGVTDMAIKNKIVNPKHSEYYFLDDINALGAQKVHTDTGIFNNSLEAAKAYSISNNGMKHRVNSDKWPDFYYLDERDQFTSPQIKNEN